MATTEDEKSTEDLSKEAPENEAPPRSEGAEETDDVAKKIKRIIISQLSLEEEQVVDNASFRDDLDVDSLDIVELVMAIEEEFELEIPDEDAEKVKTVKDMVDYIKTKT